MRRASNVVEVEYEVLCWLRDNIDISELRSLMATDKHSKKRWETGVSNVCSLLDNMCSRRLHRLPKDHDEYKEKK